MDKDRLKRYKEKLEYLDKTIKHLRDWTLNVEENEFTNEVELQKRYSIYHAFQILVEIVSDLAAMILKDENIIPKDDYSNLDVLNEKEIINFEVYKKLKEANGLRNRIVHKYNGIDDTIAYKRLSVLTEIFIEFENEVNIWLQKAF